ADVATDVVRVVAREFGCGRDVRGDDAVPKTGREPFDLARYLFGDIDGGSVRHMRVRPNRVGALRVACGVEGIWLGEQHVGVVGVAATGDLVFGVGGLFAGAAEVHGRGAMHAVVAPGDRTVEHVVDFCDAVAVLLAEECSAVFRGQLIAGDLGEGAGRGVEDDGVEA